MVKREIKLQLGEETMGEHLAASNSSRPRKLKEHAGVSSETPPAEQRQSQRNGNRNQPSTRGKQKQRSSEVNGKCRLRAKEARISKTVAQ